MGKVKRNKNKPHKENPNGLPTVKDLQDEELEKLPEENTVQTILEQMQSSNVEEKFCGLQTLAMFIEDAKHSDEIIQNDIIRVAAPLMFDSSSSVRNAAAGALRNVSTLGSQVCEIMVEQDIMTPLIAFFHEYGDKWTPKDSKDKNKFDEDGDTIIQNINLLWNLCEYSEIATKHVNDSRILIILVKFLDATFGADVTIASLQSLFVITEDNKVAISKIKALCEDTLKKTLIIESINPDALTQKILSAGILINFCFGNITVLPTEVIALIMSILSATLTVDHRMACNQLSSAIPLEGRTTLTTPKIKRTKEQLQLESQLKALQYLLEAQQTGVEIIANLCSNEDSDDDSIDSSNISDFEDDINDQASDCSKENVFSVEDKLLPEVIEGFIAHELFKKVWARTILPPENTLQILQDSEEGKNLCKKIYNLRNRSFLCINNMISCLPIETLGGVQEVYRIWIDTGKMVFKTASTDDELLESATSVMRAALDKIKEKCNEGTNDNSDLFSSLAITDVELMLNGIRQCNLPNIRANLIRMVGDLALFFITKSTESAVTIASSITNFILDHCHKEHEAWVLAESIDALMDLYAEDDTDSIAAKLDLVSKMSSLVPILTNKKRLQKKSLGDHASIVTTALANLPRFIKYKKNRVSKLKL